MPNVLFKKAMRVTRVSFIFFIFFTIWQCNAKYNISMWYNLSSYREESFNRECLIFRTRWRLQSWYTCKVTRWNTCHASTGSRFLALPSSYNETMDVCHFRGKFLHNLNRILYRDYRAIFCAVFCTSRMNHDNWLLTGIILNSLHDH